MSDWLNVLKGEFPNDALEALISDTVRSVDALLTTEPKTEDRVGAILGRHLAETVTPTTWDSAIAGLRHYLGDELAYFIAWSLTQDQGQADNLARVQKHASPAVSLFLQALLGIHGPAFDRAFTAWKELPNDWESIARDIVLDQTSGAYRINVRIRKYNQEEVSLEVPPVSLLNLTRSLLDILRSIKELDALSTEQVDGFLIDACAFGASRGRAEMMTSTLAPPTAAKPRKRPKQRKP